AMKFLAEAQTISGESMSIDSIRVEIVQTEAFRKEQEAAGLRQANQVPQAVRLEEEAKKLTTEASQLLDAQVAKQKTFSAYLLRAAYLASVGKVDEAEKDYVHLITFKENGGGFFALGRFYVEQKKPDKAVDAFAKGLEAFPKDMVLKRALMETLFQREKEGDRPRAEAILAELEKAFPRDPSLMWLRASLALGAKDPKEQEKAVPILQKVVELEPTAAPAQLALINQFRIRGQMKEAYDTVLRALGASPRNTKLILARGIVEQAMNRQEIAVTLAEMVLKDEPDNADARRILTLAAGQTRQKTIIAKAQAAVIDQISRKPTAELLCLSSSLYRLEDRFDDAGKQIDRAATLAPDDATVIGERMLCLGQQNKFDQVAQLAGQAKAKDPKAKNVLMTAAVILGSSKSAEHRRKSVELQEHVVALGPENVAVRLPLATLLYEMGEVARAEQHYREVLKVDPNQPMALNGLAWIVQEVHKDYQAAFDMTEKAIKLTPNNPFLRDTRGTILLNLPGRLKDARAEFEKVLEIVPAGRPERTNAIRNLVDICGRLRDQSKAREYQRMLDTSGSSTTKPLAGLDR
ncbi:MAG: tetratricopeptide repeat protein, partial [Planctomycetota bacterium]|nr:tetratricopeptide repeat protein [Planctomycetota bacterium]